MGSEHGMKNAITVGINRFLGRFVGYEMKSRACLEEYVFPYQLAKLFRHLNVRCVLDVGANRGGFVEFLRRSVHYEGLIIGFEPVSQQVQILRRIAKKDPNLIVYDWALGSADTRMDINVMKGHTFSSFLKPDPSRTAVFREKNVVEHTENVEVRKLDSIMAMLSAKHGAENIYLKLDTQGYDLEVVKGARAVLPQVLALQTELSVQQIYAGMPNLVESLQQLTAWGFDVAGLYPVTRDDLLRVIEFDCVMINRASAPRPSS